MKARILVVEDEAIVQMDLQSRLKRLGHSVVGLASAGEEAVSKAAELAPDVVLMDVRLKGPMDGIEAARRIRAQRDVPVIFVTANTPKVEAGDAETLSPCLSKPFRTNELETTIAQVLEGRGSPPSATSDPAV
ncbi:MAG TPA: response regulator [Bryobacteraceae bacterium]|nr:response regulator [Bryobacteraceae bacterium]